MVEQLRELYRIGTAMNPHHNRFLLRPFLVSLPNIEMQTILAQRTAAPHLTGAAHLAGNLSESGCIRMLLSPLLLLQFIFFTLKYTPHGML